MSRKQEYIAKIRYKNDLPPPLLPPKLLKYKIIPDEEVDSSQLITSLYTKTNVTPLIELDKDLGMPLDLLKIPGVLNDMDPKNLYGHENVKLQKEDRILLRDPRVDRLIKTDMSKITFLRRTEYISNTTASKYDKKRLASSLDDDDDDRVLTPSQIVSKVESTFDCFTKEFEKIKHPIKKNVNAVKTWDLLPDTVSMDQNFFTIKLVGSAALNDVEKEKLSMSTALFRPIELEEDEWMSVYTTDSSNSALLRSSLQQPIDELTEDESIYKFKRLRDFEMKQIEPNMGTNLFSELILNFNDDKNIVYYKPLRSKLELRKRRVNDAMKYLVRNYNWDQINLKVRNPTTQETKVRDKIRMRFDPIDFPNIEDEDDYQQEFSNEKESNESKNVIISPAHTEIKFEESLNDSDKNIDKGSELSENKEDVTSQEHKLVE